MQDANPTVSPARSSTRLGLYLPFALFAIIVVAWSAFWFYARYRATEALDLWLGLEKTAGRLWTCDDRRIDGFPFRLQITCAKPTFTGPVRGESGQPIQVQGVLGGFAAEALIYNPNHLLATLQSPLSVSASDGRSLDLTWQSLRASVIGRQGALGEFSLEAKDIAAKLMQANEPVATAKGFELHLRQEPGAEPGTVDLASYLADASIPLVDGLAGSRDPFRLEVQIRADKLNDIGVAENVPALLDAWRDAGGKLQIGAVKLQKGPMALNATGQLGLDPAHYPTGQLDTTISGADNLLAQLGFGGKGMKIGGVLGSILGGGKAPAGEQAGAPGMRLAVRLERGKAYIGPFGLALRPLY